MANILITGAQGFIGSHLYKALEADGHLVVGIDNFSHACKNYVSKVDYCDVRNEKELIEYFPHCDVVFHLAAQISVDKSIRNPQETIDVNIAGTQNVLDLARKFGVRVVFASSSEVYGSAQAVPMSESHPLDAQSPYGVSKVAGDRLCYAQWKTYPNTNITVVRNFNTFGEFQANDSYGGVMAKFVKFALENKPLEIYGDGTQERDYMHVRDAVQAYKLALPLTGFNMFNFGSGRTIKINDLAKSIVEIIGSKSEIIHIEPRRGEVQCLLADISKAKERLGFLPNTNFWADLKEYIKWARKE